MDVRTPQPVTDQQFQDVINLLNTWMTRGDNTLSGMVLLLGVAIRGIRLSVDDKTAFNEAELWAMLQTKMQSLWLQAPVSSLQDQNQVH